MLPDSTSMLLRSRMSEPGESRSGLPSSVISGGAVTTSLPRTTSLGASRWMPGADAARVKVRNKPARTEANAIPTRLFVQRFMVYIQRLWKEGVSRDFTRAGLDSTRCFEEYRMNLVESFADVSRFVGLR